MRVGFSSDIHRLVKGRKLVLGGIEIPSDVGEFAHSDGDVVFHALSEAILGAISLGDLGEHFPDTDKDTEGMNSEIILRYVKDKLLDSGLKISNIDISIYLEKPKLKDYKKLMIQNIANILDIDVYQVSVKAGTNEGLDAIGEGLAVKADAIVCLE